MSIHWTKDHPEDDFSSRTGTDENGNTFHMPANGETITVTTPDGRNGLGWTPTEALQSVVQPAATADALSAPAGE